MLAFLNIKLLDVSHLNQKNHLQVVDGVLIIFKLLQTFVPLSCRETSSLKFFTFK